MWCGQGNARAKQAQKDQALRRARAVPVPAMQCPAAGRLTGVHQLDEQVRTACRP
ncbi:hypothetical protein GCM10023320_07530 [Pseudonocardia adelaidensis]|uniref:Uncharacterized protein n=1 Tax=Pseudonocardia adelaidensis TaxID=648754 RepID=A0ABP9NBY9_9PSEU